MKNLLYISAASLLVLLASCNEENTSSKHVTQLNPTDTFRFDFPIISMYDRQMDSGFYKQMLHYDSLIQIQTLFKGFDSVQIRIWLDEIYNDTSHLFIFKNENKNWEGELCTLIENPKKDTVDIIWIKKKCETITPNSGWNKFLNKIFELEIFSLPDDHYIDGWKHGLSSHDERPTFEVATKNSYRLYRYSGLDTTQINFPEAKNVCNIFELIKQEFNYVPLTNYCYGNDRNSSHDSIPFPKIKTQEIQLEDIKPEKKRKSSL